MPANAAAANALGTMGTICWSGQLLPQIWKSWRTESTEGLSEYLVLLWAIAGVFLGVFVIEQNLNIPLILQPQLFSFLSLISWAQCIYYGHKKSKLFCILLWAGCVLAFGGFEAGMVFAVKPAAERGNQSAIDFFGIFSSVIISLGLFPQYYEIWKYGEVKGISLTFMTVDLLGGVFSDLSLVFSPTFDTIAAITYSLVVVLDGVVLLLAVILNPRAKRRRMRQALSASEDNTNLEPSTLTVDVMTEARAEGSNDLTNSVRRNAAIHDSESPRSPDAQARDEQCQERVSSLKISKEIKTDGRGVQTLDF